MAGIHDERAGFTSVGGSSLAGGILTVVSIAVLANFISGYNARLAVVGMPNIARGLNADVWGLVWIIQGFMLGSTFVQLVVGRLADIYGRVRLFNIGLLVFTLSAFASGISSGPYILALSRFAQGVGGAFLMSLSVTILTDNAPRGTLGRWLGLTQVAWRAGGIIGLTLSGLIIDALGWRWIFLSQVPIGLLALYWSAGRLRESYRPAEKQRVDLLGFALFTSSITTLLISLTLTGYGYRQASAILLATSIALLAFFVAWELRASSPALDLGLFRVWQFTGGIIAQLLYAIGFGATLTLISIYLQVAEGFSASATGLLLVPFELSFLVLGVAGGWLSDIFGFAPVTVAGLSLASMGAIIMTGIPSISKLLVGEVVFGVGAGLFVSPNTSSIMMSVPPHRRGVASSLRALSFNIGFMLSLNLAMLTLTHHVPREIATRLVMLGEAVGTQQLSVGVQQLTEALRSSFKLQSLIMALAIPFCVTRMKKQLASNEALARNNMKLDLRNH